MFEDSPIKKILFDKLVEMGRLPSNPSESTIQTINDISNSEALQLLRSVGVGPTISKAGGGMMNIDEMIRPVGYKNGGETGFLTEPPPGMEFKPKMTMEYRDYNQNGKEDRSEGLYLLKDFQPKKEEEDNPNWLKDARKKFDQGFIKTPELSDEQKKRLEIQRIIREKQREEMGLPDSIQLLNQGGSVSPIGMAAGGPIPPEDSVLEKLKKNDPDKELRDKGILPPLQERQGIMAQPAGLMEDTENFMILGMKLQLLRAADSLAEMDRIEKLNPEEIIREFEIFMGEKGA